MLILFDQKKNRMN